MTVNFTICDDENKELEYLTSIIDEWGNLTCNTVQIKCFSSAESFLFDYEESRSFDILLLDIQMQELDGISLAQKIRQTDNRVQIIFITGFDEYMGKGYDVAALHYLLKPVKKKSCSRCSIRRRKIYTKAKAIAFLTPRVKQEKSPLRI